MIYHINSSEFVLSWYCLATSENFFETISMAMDIKNSYAIYHFSTKVYRYKQYNLLKIKLVCFLRIFQRWGGPGKVNLVPVYAVIREWGSSNFSFHTGLSDLKPWILLGMHVIMPHSELTQNDARKCNKLLRQHHSGMLHCIDSY